MGEHFFSVIFYSFYIFEGNYIDFQRTLEVYGETANSNEFLFDGEKQINLHIGGGREIARLIHNYSAAWLSLVDHSRRVNEKLKENSLDEIQIFAAEYEDRLSTQLKDTFENIFVKDLRRYVQHKKVPVPILQFKMVRIDNLLSEIGKPVFEGGFSFEFNSQDIEDFNWNSNVKEYIKNNRTIPIGEIIDKHFSVMKDFYLWIQFRDHQLHPYAPDELREITFDTWKQEILKNSQPQ